MCKNKKNNAKSYYKAKQKHKSPWNRLIKNKKNLSVKPMNRSNNNSTCWESISHTLINVSTMTKKVMYGMGTTFTGSRVSIQWIWNGLKQNEKFNFVFSGFLVKDSGLVWQLLLQLLWLSSSTKWSLIPTFQ